MPRDPGPARTVPTTYSPLAAFLSYLVPGLGQVTYSDKLA